MRWLFLVLSIFLEAAGTTCMKLSEGFTRTIPSVLIWVFYGVSFTLFVFVLKKGISLSIAYALWAGVGTTLIVLVGIFYFKEPVSILKVLFLSLIIVGVAGLTYVSESAT